MVRCKPAGIGRQGRSVSSIPRQLAAPSMMILARRVENAIDVTIECSHHADLRELY
jgi:hypothetical protein